MRVACRDGGALGLHATELFAAPPVETGYTQPASYASTWNDPGGMP